MIALTFPLLVAMTANGADESANETQVRGVWSDPSTGLMWAGKDNDENATWRKATRHCSDLRLAGYSDWRLATIEELEGLYDGSAYNSLPIRQGVTYILGGKAKGGLFLSGTYHWSSSRVPDDRGRPSGYAWQAWQYYFRGGRKHAEPLGYHQRALCVRRSVR